MPRWCASGARSGCRNGTCGVPLPSFALEAEWWCGPVAAYATWSPRTTFARAARWSGRGRVCAGSWTSSWWGGSCCSVWRRRDDLLQYRPAIDWASRVARAASSTSRKHYVSAARLVEVRLEEVSSESTHVDILVDPGIVANYRSGAAIGGGIVGLVVGFGVGVALATLLSLTLAAVGGVVAGSAAALAVASVAGRGFRRRLHEIHLEVEGILDGLERESGLEPPPSAWRRWVRRHFHGVAREMIGKKD